MPQRPTQDKDAVYIYPILFVLGGLLTFLSASLMVSLFAGFRTFLENTRWAVFWDNFSTYFWVHSLTKFSYAKVLYFLFGGMAAIWGYRTNRLFGSSRVYLFFFILISAIIFVSPRIVATANIPRRFAEQGPEFINEMLWLNITYIFVNFFAYALSVLFVFYFHRRYGRKVKNILEKEL